MRKAAIISAASIAAAMLASAASAATYNFTGQSVTIGAMPPYNSGTTANASVSGGSVSGGSVLSGQLNFTNGGVTGGGGAMTYSASFNINLGSNSYTTSGVSCSGVGCTAFPASDTFSVINTANGFYLAFNNRLYNSINYDFVMRFTEVAEVPVPAAAWLFGSALLGLGGMARRRKA